MDYDEVTNDLSRHGIAAAERLRGKLPTDCIRAMESHDHRSGLSPVSRLDKALKAVDSLAFLIENAGKGKEGLDVKTLRRELESTCTTQPWLRDNIIKCEELGQSLDEFIPLCLEVFRQQR